MEEIFSRTEMLIGLENIEKLKKSSVAVFGIGGVGSYASEALVRSGVGKLTFVDNDCITESNLNRQLIATKRSIGQLKVEVIRDRALSINPEVEINIKKLFYSENVSNQINLKKHDYIIDAIDTVSAKLILIERCKKLEVPIISCMGAGNKMDPTRFEIQDIYQTSVCPLARVMRRELKKRKILSLQVVYSTEQVIMPLSKGEKINGNRSIPGSIAFVPSVAGLIMAGKVIKDLIQWKDEEK